MNYQSFITTIEREAGINDDEEAARTACLTLHTLAQRISAGEAEDLAERLPTELRRCVATEGPPETFHVDELLERIERELGVDRQTAERDARAVLAALRRAVGANEFADMRAQLPKDFGPLLDAAASDVPLDTTEMPFVGPLSLDQFLDRVAEATGLDRDGARRAAEAVLEVLTTRVTWGEVEDFVPLLPPELRLAVERGRAQGGNRAIPMSLDEFVSRIAKLEGVPRVHAVEHTRAVLAVLRAVIGEDEWHDLVAQLPEDYRDLYRRR